MPFEKVRLTAVKVSGDSGPPMFAKVDLTHLPDEDIHALALILPSLAGLVMRLWYHRERGGNSLDEI
jgi:hypothetical protein